jgi:sulfur-carrier protein
MAKVLIPSPLRQYVGGQKEVEIPGATVGEILATLTTEHGDLKRHLFNDEGRLRTFVSVYLNDQDIRHLERDGTAAGASDTVSIVPAIAGGLGRR